MPSRHILITGGAGFIRSHLAGLCLSEGHRVTIVDNLSTGCIDNIPKKADFLNLDISQAKTYKRLPKDCSIVFHLAAQSSGEISNEKTYLDFKTNAGSTLLLLLWCKRFRNMRFLYSSSMAVYGNPPRLPVRESDTAHPISFYGISKLTSERYILSFSQFGIIPTIFRLFSVYGPRQDLSNRKQGIVSIYISYLINKEELLVKGSGKRFRDLIYIDDVLKVWIEALHRQKTFGKIYNLCTGKKTLVSKLVELEIEIMGFNPKTYPVRYEGNTPNDQFGVYGDNALLDRDIPRGPFTPLREGLKRTIEWYKYEKNKKRDNRYNTGKKRL